MNNQNQNIHFKCLPNHLIYLQEVTPKSTFNTSNISKQTNYDSIINALKYRFTFNYLGKQYQKISVPCIPAQQFTLISNSSQQNQSETKPLIKVPYQTKISGFASGKRSAIVFDHQNQKIYRYKGCGNFDQGFVIQNDQPRGSHYIHTAKRQLYMTKHISQILKQNLGIQSANKPLLAYEYSNDITNLKVSNCLPLLSKFCCVFETVGDRRAGTHLISPLQILFLNLCELQSIQWKQIFVSKKRHNEQDGLIQAMVDYQFEVLKDQKFIKKYDLRPDVSQQHVDLIHEKDIIIKNSQEFKEMLQKIVNKYMKDQKNKQKIIQSLSKIQMISDIIATICAKIGYQMGRIKRIFCQNDINWGFFNDHGTSWHCNAHLNNLVICYPQKDKPILLPLDFDLAFTKKEFINIDLTSQTYGLKDQDLFEQLMLGQYNAMQYSLSGFQIMSNFNYTIQSKKSSDGKSDQIVKQKLRMARTAFRDTLMNSFRGAMRNKKQIQKIIEQRWNNNIQKIRDIIEACLLISAQFQT